MTVLGLDSGPPEALFLVNNRLREATLKKFNERTSVDVVSYSPWMCFSSMGVDVPHELVTEQSGVRGELVSNSRALEAMRSFLQSDGADAIRSLPGNKEDWLPARSQSQQVFDSAKGLIHKLSPSLNRIYEEMVDIVIPLGGGKNRGFSTHLARGAIFRSLPNDDNQCDVAYDLAHELGHQVLMAWQSVDPILSSDPEAPVFSQIRRRNRPAIQSLHATVALAFMQRLQMDSVGDKGMQEAAEKRGANYTESLTRSLVLATEASLDNCEFTKVGQQLFSEIRTHL